MLLVIGPLEFEAARGPHFTSLRHQYELSWPQHDRFGQPPNYQFTGAGPEEVGIEGTVYPEYFRGIEEVRNLPRSGSQPLVVASGSGDVYGQWIVKSVSNVETLFDRFGQPRKVDFTIQLCKFNTRSSAALGRLF
jgi:phage protein U